VVVREAKTTIVPAPGNAVPPAGNRVLLILPYNGTPLNTVFATVADVAKAQRSFTDVNASDVGRGAETISLRLCAALPPITQL
jgi:hypothetical protein